MLSRPMIDRIAFFGISWYAILIVSAILLGYAYCSREARRMRMDQDTIIDFLLYAIPMAIVFARIYYVIPLLQNLQLLAFHQKKFHLISLPLLSY